jgi:hypothetical protein
MNYLYNLPLQIYERWQPDALINRKLKQGRCNDFDKLSGTIADCKISKNRKFITKKIRQDKKENDINQLYIIGKIVGNSVVNSWTEAAILEYDCEHEASIQKKFYKLWKNSDIIKIPKVKSFTEDSIKMEFVDCPRLADVIDNTELFEKAVASTAFFFFNSINRAGLVHGDISLFNVLVDPKSKNGRICVIDYGITCKLKNKDINNIKEDDNLDGDPSKISDAWNTEGFQFNWEWWEKLNLLERKSSDISGVFIRSVVALTRIACMGNLIVPKSFND